MQTFPEVVGFAVQVLAGADRQLWQRQPDFLQRGAINDLQVSGSHASVAGWTVGSGALPGRTAADDRRWVLLAGEIYNGEELAEAVDQAAGCSDAELLLALWRRYGPTAARLINGRFAAVVLDGDRLTVVTDHAGSIPLYLADTGNGLAISTEAKAFSRQRGAPRILDVPGHTRTVRGLSVVQLRGASAVQFELADDSPGTGFSTWLPPQHRLLRDPSAAPGLLRKALAEAVRVRSRDGDTVVLSGGIDSSSVVGLAAGFRTGIKTVSLGTDAGNEYDAARLVAEHVGTEHHEVFESSETVVTRLPWAIAAAEITDPDVIEYLLPLVALYQKLNGEPRRIITGYGADIPLGGMYRTVADLHQIDELIVADLAGVDGLNEMSPLLSGLAGHWSTHPFWDRNVLDVLLSAEPGLKRRNDMDKWILRESVRDLLPELTVNRPKLGVHEGSGTTSTWTLMLEKFGAPATSIGALKQRVSERIYDQVVVQGIAPDEVATHEVMADCVREDLAAKEVSV